MLQPSGFCQHSLSTSLGTVVYYSNEAAPWTGGREISDRPTLVFLHGFGGGSSAYEWSRVYPAFASEYRILAPNLIGWGESDHLTRSYTIDDYLTNIQEFLEATCSDAAIVIASSLTAALTIRVAIAHPQLFKSLILTCPSGLSDFGSDYTRSFFAQLVSTPILDRLLYKTLIATEFGIRSFLEQRQFAKPQRVYQELVDVYLSSALQPDAEYSALSFVKGDLCFDLAHYIAQLTTPTAMIWGKEAQFTGPEIGQKLAALNPQAVRSLVVLEDVGLTPQLELPAVTIGLVRKAISDLAG